MGKLGLIIYFFIPHDIIFCYWMTNEHEINMSAGKTIQPLLTHSKTLHKIYEEWNCTKINAHMLLLTLNLHILPTFVLFLVVRKSIAKKLIWRHKLKNEINKGSKAHYRKIFPFIIAHFQQKHTPPPKKLKKKKKIQHLCHMCMCMRGNRLFLVAETFGMRNKFHSFLKLVQNKLVS